MSAKASAEAISEWRGAQATFAADLEGAKAGGVVSLVEREGEVRFMAWRPRSAEGAGIPVEIKKRKAIWAPESTIKAQGLEKDFSSAEVVLPK
eukprot:4229036-Pyramimonas_sp.AAC.1